MNMENVNNYFKEYKSQIIITIIGIPITALINMMIDYPFKELLSNYISSFILFILFSFVLLIFKEKKILIILWITFIISIVIHSAYLYSKNEHVKIPEINFYGLYSSEKEGLIKTNNDKLTDESILKGIKETDFFKLKNKYLPNYILYFFDKEEILRNYENKNNLFSILIYKEDNTYKIVNYLNEDKLDSPNNTKKHLDLIKNTFNEILNLNSINKEDIVKDLLLVYQQNFIRISALSLLELKVYDYKKAYEIYNISTNNIYTILHKYKRLISNTDIINKINFLLNNEQSNSKYILASMNIIANDYNSAVKNLLACMQLSPYYPYDNYEEFLKDYEAYYHVINIDSYDYLKSRPELSDIFNKDENNTFQKNGYTDNLSSNFLEIPPPFFRIRDIFMKNDLTDETFILIENKFKELLNRDNIFKFYFADIVKFLPKGKEKSKDIYLDRLDESKILLEDFIKLDSNLNNIVYQKLIALYVFKQSYEKKDYSKEINELFKQIGENRLINGPTP